MTDQTLTPSSQRLSLKEPAGWFAAGPAFRTAMALLSDGAFRLFAYICLEADRRTGCFRATHGQLATVLGKSKRAIGTYVAELQARSICLVKPGKNQFECTTLEVCDAYWPYHRVAQMTESPKGDPYVESVRECFLALSCTSGRFGVADVASARDLQRRAIPLAVIEEAMLMGACRKYMSWFEGRALEPIQSLGYFKQLIAEVQENPFPPGYSGYLRKKVKQFAESWNEWVKSGKSADGGPCPDMPSREIVQ
jgi:hypothetical protein